MEEEQICRNLDALGPEAGTVHRPPGELRQIERLRHEAQANGNRNWCRDHAFFCAFLDHTLLDSGVLSPEEGERLHGVLVHLRSCGEVAHRYHRGELTERELEEDYHGETACTDDAPYDLVRGSSAAPTRLSPISGRTSGTEPFGGNITTGVTYVESIEIPTMLFWENGNTWYGSKGEARFYPPSSHEDGGLPHAGCRAVEGPLSRAPSQVLAGPSLGEDGRSS
ncbi:MAG: hypothetical protein ACLT5P_11395 [Flavonifractor plautii]